MRGNTLAVILSLAILAGSPMSAYAASTGPSNNGIGSLSDGGGGGAGPGDGLDGLVDCAATSRDCGSTPPPPRVRKRTKLKKAVSFDDNCTCRPYPLKVNNQTQIVLDCYETKFINGVERTRYCRQRPEIYKIR